MNSLPTAITPSLVPGGSGPAVKPSVTFELPLPPALTPSTGQPASPVNVTVLATSKGVTTLALPDGTQITARLNPPLPPGSQLQFTPPTAPAPSPSLAATITLPPHAITLIKLMPPATSSATTGTPVSIPTPPVATAPSASSASLPVLILQPGVAFPGSQPTTPVLQPFLAPGPVQLLNAPALPAQALTATISGSPDATGSQAVTLTSPAGVPMGSSRVMVGPSLPVGTQLSLHLLPESAGAPLSPSASPRPALLLQPVPLPPASPGSGPLNNHSPTTSLPTTTSLPALSQLNILSADPANPLPIGLHSARILPQSAGPGQSLQLPGGQTALLQSPVPLPAGSVLMLAITPTRITVTQANLPTPPATSAAPLPTPALTPPAASLPPTGTTLSATVTGHPATGQVLVTVTSSGPLHNQPLILTLPTSHSTGSHSLPVGSQLTLQLQLQGQVSLTSVILPPDVARAQAHTETLTTLGQTWPNLNQLLKSITGMGGTMANGLAQAVTAKLPQLQALLPTLLPYADAVARGQPAQTLTPEVLTMARALGLDLDGDLARLTQLQQSPQPTASTGPASQALSQPAQQTAVEPWRGLLFPYQEQPHEPTRQARMFWRRQPTQSSDQTTPPNLRFVIELDLSRFGPLQLDGLMQTLPGSPPSLWLKLRHLQPVPAPTMAQQLQNLAEETLRSHGMTGTLTLEHLARFPIDPTADMLAEAQRDWSAPGTMA